MVGYVERSFDAVIVARRDGEVLDFVKREGININPSFFSRAAAELVAPIVDLTSMVGVSPNGMEVDFEYGGATLKVVVEGELLRIGVRLSRDRR